MFEFERRGYLRAGCFVPEVVIEHPEYVKMLHEEFVHAGSDVVLAFTVSNCSYLGPLRYCYVITLNNCLVVSFPLFLFPVAEFL